MQKKFFILLFTFFSISFAYGQTANDSILPLFTKGKTWSIGHFVRSASNKLSVNDWSEIISIKRDTLIDSKRWWFFNSSSGFNKDNLNLTNCGNFTTDGHKVYYENVTLYYDFGMQVGDTIDYGGDSWFVLDSIKPQQIYNLEYRNYYYLSHHYSSNFYHQTVWIEGIGCTAGLYDPTSGFETVGGFESLLCVEENGQQIYKTNSYDSCFIPRYPTIDFLQQKKRWSIANIDANSGDTTSYYYTFDGDTAILSNYVIGNDYSLITHKKLFMSTHENYNKEDYIGGLVESANSVYFLPMGESTHYLLYDFGLIPGDIFIAQNESNDSIIVDSLIVKPFAGLERMHWYLHSLKNPDLVPITWVGGVGRLGDILHCRTGLKKDSVSSFLLCFEENGKQVYQNPLYNRCDLNYTSVPSLENHQQLIDLFSTGNGLLQLRLKSTISGEIMLYTPDGKQVLKEPIKEMESTICTPASGLLLYRFVTEKGEVQAGKVVVR